MTTAVIYARKSNKSDSDDERGRSASVRTQLRLCRERAEQEGWQVVDEYVDNAISAAPGKPDRPRFEDLLADARAGKFDVILAYKPDRLDRDPAANERLIQAMRAGGVRLLTLDAGWVDPSRSGDRTNMRFRSVVGVTEVENISDRVTARARTRAVEERRYTAGRVPFGWRWRDPCPGGREQEADRQDDRKAPKNPSASGFADLDVCLHANPCKAPGLRPRVGYRTGLEVDPDTAPALAQAYRDVADGMSLAATHRRLASRVDVGKMTATTLGKILRNPRNAGLVAYKDEIVGQAADGQRIVEESLWRTVHATLTDPGRRTSPGRPAGTLVSGILRCEHCGAPMNASNRHSRSGTTTKVAPVYLCSRELRRSRHRELVDPLVVRIVGDLLGRLAEQDRLVGDDDTDDPTVQVRERIAELEAEVAVLQSHLAQGLLRAVDFTPAVNSLRAAVDVERAKLEKVAKRPGLAALSRAEDVTAEWERLTVEDVPGARVVLREVLDPAGIVSTDDRALVFHWAPFIAAKLPTTRVDLPSASRNPQRDALTEALGRPVDERIRELRADGLSWRRVASVIGEEAGRPVCHTTMKAYSEPAA